MTQEIIHSIILIATIAVSFLFPKTSLAQYDLIISAGLFIVLFLVKKIISVNHPRSRLIESVIFTFVVLTIVNTTGGITSPFFFLLFFLIFSLSLLLEPVISVVSTLALIIFFILFLPEGQSFKSLLPIISLAFLTPFALFLGEEYIEIKKSKIKNQKLQENTFLFLSLILKNHLKNIKQALENYMGDHELEIIKKTVNRMEKLIEKFEKSN